ncbi:MAG: hypothetical protein JXB49_00960 [Bacteroidales bacterium]|nr:hypothetical protein [Bacteroidales bacterium]MBN2819300.1 hypothetical protein [Bacteroidales bacterium]
MRDFEQLQDLFLYDELIQDYEFSQMVFNSEKTNEVKYDVAKEEIVWGDLL